MKSGLTILTHPLAALATLGALAIASPAAAHHAMDRATPATLLEGLLSGFGHPIIGFDHLLFIVAVGVACYYFGQRTLTIAAFLAGTLAGTLLHLRAANLLYADAWVAASLILLGVLFVRRNDFLKSKAATALFALSGVAHGYAYGEAIVGAEATPLLAYLGGFTLVQFAIALSGYAIAHYAATKKPVFKFLETAGGTLASVGAGFLMFALLTSG